MNLTANEKFTSERDREHSTGERRRKESSSSEEDDEGKKAGGNETDVAKGEKIQLRTRRTQTGDKVQVVRYFSYLKFSVRSFGNHVEEPRLVRFFRRGRLKLMMRYAVVLNWHKETFLSHNKS